MNIKEIIVLKNNEYIGHFLCESHFVDSIVGRLNDYQNQISDVVSPDLPPNIQNAKKAICSNDRSCMFIYVTPNKELDVPGFRIASEFLKFYNCIELMKDKHWIKMLIMENTSTYILDLSQKRTEEFGIKYHDGDSNQNLVYPTNCDKLNKFLELTDKMKQVDLTLTAEQENKLLHDVVNELLEENKRLSSIVQNNQYDLKA